jgi:hypothetical protein
LSTADSVNNLYPLLEPTARDLKYRDGFFVLVLTASLDKNILGDASWSTSLQTLSVHNCGETVNALGASRDNKTIKLCVAVHQRDNENIEMC